MTIIRKERERKMACMEHECHECGYVWFNNSGVRMCPMCCSHDCSMIFDEFVDE